MRSSRPVVSLLVLALALALAPAAGAATPVQSYIVTCAASCNALAAAVAQIPGAKVDRMFQNVAGAVVTLPVTAVPQVQGRTDVLTVDKDVVLAPPTPERSQVLPAADGLQALAPAQVKTLAGGSPADYSFNNQLIGASTFQAQGTIGSGVVVGVIDSGVANNPAVVPALAGSVLGGETFLSPAEDPVTSATSTLNNPHGTWVSTVIAGHVVFLFGTSSSIVQALSLEAPGSVIPCSVLGCPSSLAGVPMIGVAPGASLYAFKIFNSAGGGAPVSRIAAAMDRAITLRRNFDSGAPVAPTNPGCGAEGNPCVYDSLPIQVVNMSLGGLTLTAGRGIEDLLGKEMVKAGIILVTSSGNSGPGAMTTESPATGAGAISSAAASTAPHERLFWDLVFGLGLGPIARPFSGIQTASFSSRGPSAEGRYDVDLSANGFSTFAEGADGSLSLVSGTSFSAPTISGAAALLRESFPAASATQIRNALAATGNPALLADGSTRIDRGSGFLDIPAAAAKLASGHVDTTLPSGLGTPSVLVNLLPLGIFPIHFNGDHYVQHLSSLLPGQTVQLFVPTAVDTAGLTVSLQNVALAPPAQQNQVFGDAVFLTVLDAPTSAAAPNGNVNVDAATLNSPERAVIANPTPGVWTAFVQGFSVNSGVVQNQDLWVLRVNADGQALHRLN